MATIEPRLIHLLNEATTTPRPHNAELPPIRKLYPQSSSRPHPIEPGARQRPETVEGGPLASQTIAPLYHNTEDSVISPSSRQDSANYTTTDRPFSTHVSSQDLRMILEASPADNAAEDAQTKKRPVKEDFPQLPQPLKKKKASAQFFPPIIVGLLEPPSDPALFPPMSSGSFENHQRSEPQSQPLTLTKPAEVPSLPEENPNPSPSPDAERTPSGKIKRRAAKPRRKWSEAETNHLLLGVDKHGVGRWTDILDDKDYRFNDRSAGDLKDRFRTCCPEELRVSTGAKNDGSEPPTLPKNNKKPKKGIMSENILNDTEEDIEAERGWQQNDFELAPKQRKSRAHRKKLEDLAELGIKGPFKKSQRRERRPFSEQDDREILEGFEMYGPHWTKIQRDPRFNLSSRQPTDLRDRLRNKYPDKFERTEKTAMQVREPGGRGNNLLEPSVNMNIDGSLNLSKTSLMEPQLLRTSSRDEMPKWSSLGSTVEPPPMYWGEGGVGFPTGEMDISRLLLDDSQIGEPIGTDRRGFG